MQVKDGNKIYAELERAKRRYDQHRTIFEGLREHARYLATDDFQLKGISLMVDGAAFCTSFLDCTAQIRFLYDRKNDAGIVVIEDPSMVPAAELWRFTFNSHGIVTSGLEPAERGDRDPFDLNHSGDSRTIVLAAIESALDRVH